MKERQRTNISGELTPNSVYNEETILHNIIRTEVIAELHAAIHRLPAKSSEVFCKLYIEGKSVAETAKEMQLTVSTIKSHKRNGLMMLRTMIKRVVLIVFIELLTNILILTLLLR